MKKKNIARDFGISLVLAIIGVVITIVGVAGTAYNWESHEEFEMSYAKNVNEKVSSYYNISGNLEMMVVQTKGNSRCKYSMYSQQRTKGTWKTVASSLTFDNNNEFDGDLYSINTDAFLDTRFKGKKTAGVTTKSKLAISIGEVGE